MISSFATTWVIAKPYPACLHVSKALLSVFGCIRQRYGCDFVSVSRRSSLRRSVADTQAAFADAVNAAAFFLTNSCTLIGACPVSVSTSSVIRS